VVQPTTLTLSLPEPPSINQMLELAMKRTRRSRSGGWMKRAVPGIVYDQAHEAYDLQCLAMARTADLLPRWAPWRRWEISSVHFRLHGLRDLPELMAGLKWPVDFLVAQRYVVDDSPRELLAVCLPTQAIARANRGVTITIREVAA
jgi:hypothetical protein